MSYQVLARKWRPKRFTTLVGQEHVVRALTHALDEKRLHHAWLFTGTRGVGKTTIARILAKCLNCTGADGRGGITSTPCGQCQACVEIDAGRFVDYIEMDAASNRGVDEMAQLLEQAIYAPASARFKVYMIDEVHMLTSHAFNAMLKTLEEPPEHVKFILATTDPQKIPVTVLSRCLQFNLKQMPTADIARHLAHVLDEEHVAFDAPALTLLGRAAAGSMRDALSLTDQAIAYSAGQVTETAVRGMLGALDETYLLRILDALADDDGPALLAVCDELVERSVSFAQALQELGALLHRIALAQVVPSRSAEDDHIARLAQRLAAEAVQLYYDIVAHGRRDLSLAPDEATGFSMTLLRMLAFTIDEERATSAPRVMTPAKPVTPAKLVTAEPAPARLKPAAEVQVTHVTTPLAELTHATRPDASSSASAPPSHPPLQIDRWIDVVGRLKLTGLTRELAQQAELVRHDDASVTLRVPIRSFLSGANLEKLKVALGEHFGRPVAVTVEVGAVQGATLASTRNDERAARQADAEAAIGADPFVQALVRDFGASIVPGSIKPL